MITLHVGQHWIKQTSGHLAQVSALTATHAVMYWPHIDNGRGGCPVRYHAQTYVRLDRFRRINEWQPA